MRIIILAAGKGTRLRPLTDNKPKCMVELKGRPLIQWQLDAIKKAGIDDIAIVGGYKADHLTSLGTKLIINYEYDSTNMVKTLFCAEELMEPAQDLVIAYGDIIYQPKVLDALLNCQSELAVAVDEDWKTLWSLRMEDPLSDAETLKMDPHKRLIELGKSPKDYSEVQGQYIGLIKVRADKVREFIKVWHSLDTNHLYDGNDLNNMYMTSFIQCLIDAGWDVEAALFSGGWLEVDTVEDLHTYEQIIKCTGHLHELDFMLNN